MLSRESLLSRLLPTSFLIRERDPSADEDSDDEQEDIDVDVVEDGRTVAVTAAVDMEVWYWPVEDDIVVVVLVVDGVVAGVETDADANVVVVVVAVAVTGTELEYAATVDAVVVTGADDVALNPLLVEAPRTCILLTLPLLLRILLADAKLLLLPLLAVAPLPRPIGNETGGNSGLTVLIDVPGVIGVAGVGCTQLCCTAARGSVVFSAEDDMLVVKLRFEDKDAMPSPIWLVVDVPLLLLLLADCTGG